MLKAGVDTGAVPRGPERFEMSQHWYKAATFSLIPPGHGVNWKLIIDE